MELQFNKTLIPCLQWDVNAVQNQELTQEIRLSDDMPDIGHVVAAWGQILLRGKEWHSGSVGVTGGVMAWILYQPEEGGLPQSIETWLPFQMQWDYPDNGKDGRILTKSLLRSMDARSTSARKLIVRAGVGIRCQAVTQQEALVYTPGQLLQDIQIHKKTYPISFPSEAGEQQYVLDEELTLPASGVKAEKLIYYKLHPEIVDQKVLAGKVVFRGVAILHMLYSMEDGTLSSWDFDIPFSQYTDLDRAYSESAIPSVSCEVTNLELDLNPEGSIRLKASLTGQYLIYDQTSLEIIDDAYSPMRPVTPQFAQLEIPVILERNCDLLSADESLAASYGKGVDVCCLIDHPQVLRDGDGVNAEIPMAFQSLYYDTDGNLKCASIRTEKHWELPVDESCDVTVSCALSGKPQAAVAEGGASLRLDCQVESVVHASQGLCAAYSLLADEAQAPDPQRPSLILRKVGDNTLWELAKGCGSTVDEIMKANHLQGEPLVDQMILIPVI